MLCPTLSARIGLFNQCFGSNGGGGVVVSAGEGSAGGGRACMRALQSEGKFILIYNYFEIRV